MLFRQNISFLEKLCGYNFFAVSLFFKSANNGISEFHWENPLLADLKNEKYKKKNGNKVRTAYFV